MNKIFVISFNIIIMMIFNKSIIIAQYTNSPLKMGDYILRSCVASVVLIKNHERSQIPNLKLVKGNQMSLNDNYTNQKEFPTHINREIIQHDTTRRTKEIDGADTPLRTLDIKKRRMGDLLFTKKDHFAEISPSHYNDNRKKGAEIIVIKSVHRYGS